MEHETPILSIIIPVYRVEDCIARALDSVYSQGLEDSLFEVVAVDDGSPDRSVEIMESYRAGHANLVLLRKSNGGVSSARNLALDAARGRWVVFLDADDALAPGALREFFSKVRRFGGAEILMMQEVYARNGSEKYSWQGLAEDFHSYSGPELFRRGYFRSTVTGLVIRRDFIEKCGVRFDERVAMGEDSTFIHSLLPYARNIMVWKRVLYLIYMRDGSASRTFTRERLAACSYNLQAALELAGKVRAEAPESLPLVEFYRYSILLHYMKLSIEYRVSGALRIFREMLPEGYLPVSIENVPRERWKIRIMDKSLAVFYFLLKIQNCLKGKRVG